MIVSKISVVSLLFITSLISSICVAENEVHWADLPSDNLSEILYKYDVKLDTFNSLIQSYHQIEKTSWTHIPSRIAALKEIAIQGEKLAMGLQDNYLHKAISRIAQIAAAKGRYLEKLRLLKEPYFKKEIFDISVIPKKYTALTLNNGRKFKYQTQEIWGQYFIEAADPVHRRVLTTYHDIWTKQCPNCEIQDFFLWLEDKNVSLFFPSVNMYSRKELEHQKVVIKNGKFYFANGKLINTEDNEAEKESDLIKAPTFIKEPIFIIDNREQIYLCYSGDKYAHTSLSHYKPIIGSGSLWLKDGIITKLSLNSGHYLPTMEHYIQTFKFLENKGVKINDNIELRFYKGFDEIVTKAKEFRELYINDTSSQVAIKESALLTESSKKPGKSLFVICRGLVTKDDKLLLVSDYGKVWSAPGGHLEKGESLQECVKREVKEETGLSVLPKELVYIFDFFESSKQSHKIELFFATELITGDISKDWQDTGGKIKFVEFHALDSLQKDINIQPTFLKSGKWQNAQFNPYQGTEIK